MKTFEKISKKLNELLIEKLEDCIRVTNENYNDGIFLKPFENESLFTKCSKMPCMCFYIEETEYTEKDRIIENTIFTISITIKMENNIEEDVIKFWRYAETLTGLLEKTKVDEWQSVKLKKIKGEKLTFEIIV